jgi:IS1 family transposase
MSLNASGIRDTARVLKISTRTAINKLKKGTVLEAVHNPLLRTLDPNDVEVVSSRVDDAEVDEIERKHLTLRTRIKRLVRQTLCFSRSIEMHDIVIGLYVNRYEFGLPV